MSPKAGGLRPVRLDAVLVAQHGHVSFALAVFDVPAQAASVTAPTVAAK